MELTVTTAKYALVLLSVGGAAAGLNLGVMELTDPPPAQAAEEVLLSSGSDPIAQDPLQVVVDVPVVVPDSVVATTLPETAPDVVATREGIVLWASTSSSPDDCKGGDESPGNDSYPGTGCFDEGSNVDRHCGTPYNESTSHNCCAASYPSTRHLRCCCGCHGVQVLRLPRRGFADHRCQTWRRFA